MASDSLPEVREAAEQARRLSRALAAVDAQLDTLADNATPDAIVAALAAPVRDFDVAALETTR